MPTSHNTPNPAPAVTADTVKTPTTPADTTPTPSPTKPDPQSDPTATAGTAGENTPTLQNSQETPSKSTKSPKTGKKAGKKTKKGKAKKSNWDKNWDNLDWTLSNTELSGQTGYTSRYICIMRQKLGKPPAPRKWKVVDWENLDWTLSDIALASLTGYTNTTVANKRRELGKPPTVVFKNKEKQGKNLVKYNKAKNKVWAKVDWTQSDSDIAKKVKRTVARVCQKRKQLGIPNPNPKPRIDWANVDLSKSVDELVLELGCDPNTIYRHQKEYFTQQQAELGDQLKAITPTTPALIEPLAGLADVTADTLPVAETTADTTDNPKPL